MTDEKKKSMRHGIWKYFGAMMMDEKNGEQAISWTRFLGLITYVMWITVIMLASFQIANVKVPWELTAMMGSFAGIKGLKDFGAARKGNKP